MGAADRRNGGTDRHGPRALQRFSHTGGGPGELFGRYSSSHRELSVSIRPGRGGSEEKFENRVWCSAGRNCGAISRSRLTVETSYNRVMPDAAKSGPGEITGLLVSWSGGDQSALDRLTPFVYRELRSIAAAFLRRERPDHTLQATALVNEAYLRLIDQKQINAGSRAQFFAIAATLMRQILVNQPSIIGD